MEGEATGGPAAAQVEPAETVLSGKQGSKDSRDPEDPPAHPGPPVRPTSGQLPSERPSGTLVSAVRHPVVVSPPVSGPRGSPSTTNGHPPFSRHCPLTPVVRLDPDQSPLRVLLRRPYVSQPKDRERERT